MILLNVGVSFMENQVGWHGKAPNDEEYAIAMEDWNGGCSGSGRAGARYYPSGTLQRDIVRSMLMDGMKDNTSYGVDITYGDVFGLDGQGQEGDCATGYFNR